MKKQGIRNTIDRQPSKVFFDALAVWPDSVAATDLINRRLEVSFYHDLALLFGLTSKSLFALLGIPASAQRRWAKSGQLTVGESDYAYRQALAMRDALALFEGDKEGTIAWLNKPNRALDQVPPVSLLSTFAGMGILEALIWKIENGVNL
jgi:putative toxin-antitoxin system antitoxin component (TIGR02293 family)